MDINQFEWEVRDGPSEAVDRHQHQQPLRLSWRVWPLAAGLDVPAPSHHCGGCRAACYYIMSLLPLVGCLPLVLYSVHCSSGEEDVDGKHQGGEDFFLIL